LQSVYKNLDSEQDQEW